MKTIFSELNGALTLTEQAGVFTLSFNEAIGGGAAAGILKGQGSVVLDGELALSLSEKLLNSHLPPTVAAFAVVIEAMVNKAIEALE